MFEWTKELERKVRNILKEPITEKDRKEFTKHLSKIAEEKGEKIERIDLAIQANRVSKAIGVSYKEAFVKVGKILSEKES
jgi:predicted sugar kinase